MPDSKPTDVDSLGRAGRELYDSVTAEYELTQWELSQLTAAARLADRLDMLHTAIAETEPMAHNRHGELVANPLLAAERNTALALARLLAALRIPTGDEEAQPQRRGGARGFYQRAGRR